MGETRIIYESMPDIHKTELIRNLNKLNIMEVKMPVNELGIVNIKKLIDSIVESVKIGKDISKDGLTISDIFLVPKLVGVIINGFSKYPEATKEFKDLTAEEILELVTYAGAGILSVIFGDEFKQKVK